MVQPGTSALFLMLEKVTPDKAVEAMSKYGGTVLKTSLSKDDEKDLQDALHGPQADTQAVVLPVATSRAAICPATVAGLTTRPWSIVIATRWRGAGNQLTPGAPAVPSGRSIGTAWS